MEEKYLHRLSVVKLGATNGTESYETAKKVFRAGLDPYFKKWGIIFSGIAPEMDIVGEELIKKGKFSEFLGNTVEELEPRRILGAQLVKFCRDNPDKLYQMGETFALITKDDKPVAEDLSNIFTAGVKVDVSAYELYAYAYRFNDDAVWPAKDCRIICPSIISA